MVEPLAVNVAVPPGQTEALFTVMLQAATVVTVAVPCVEHDPVLATV